MKDTLRIPNYLTLLVLLIHCPLSSAEEPIAEDLFFSRVDYGYSSLPIWSQLTPFEEKTIFEITNGTEDLLPIYLLASGEVRTKDAFWEYNKRFEDWIISVRSKTKRKKDTRKASFLFDAMHKEFFPENEFSGYDANQSQLNRIFDTETYNCISSAMLYVAAARKLNLDVAGVLIPSHAFVQLTLPNQTIVEIETTSKSGFDIQHDKKFYQDQANEWATERALTIPSYEDYLNREIVSPIKLGLIDMWSQHVGIERMSFQHRFRLAEIKSHLAPMDINAQTNRLAFYLSEFTHLNRVDEQLTLKSMFRTITPYLIEVEKNHVFTIEVISLIAKINSTFALTLMETKNFNKGFELVKHVRVRQLDYALLDEETDNILHYAMDKYSQYLVEEKKYEEASLTLQTANLDCSSHIICYASLKNIYLSWAQEYWEIRNWEEIVKILSRFPRLEEWGDQNPIVRSNLIKAYANWADELVWDGDWEIATDKLKECIQQLPEATLCSQTLQKVISKQEAGYL
ncbi:MAG: hypothetical protein ACI9VI_002221 [Candidatus Azotimanducaceae bacterium]|jgi:tetratricopeptide (TPR) repeat protein